MAVLEIKGLTKNYGKIKAVNSLDLSISKGEIYGILGPNGSGKTTTLGMILGIIKPDGGSYKWNMESPLKNNPREQIGAILETPNFYPNLDAIENLKIVGIIKDATNTDYLELLDMVNLKARAKSKFKTYSLGMKQRLAIAATLVGDPEVIIFDEPTNGLDPQGIAEVRTILKRVASGGRTVIMASHILDEVEKICSHVAIIKNGNLLSTGAVGALLSAKNLVEIGANDMDKLEGLLRSKDWITISKKHEQYFECLMEEDVTTYTLSELVTTNSLIISHMVVRKQKLEEEFLQITSNAK